MIRFVLLLHKHERETIFFQKEAIGFKVIVFTIRKYKTKCTQNTIQIWR